MTLHPSFEPKPEEPRVTALTSAIVLRDCSLQPQAPHVTRRVCRTLMREQAIKWRQLPTAEIRPLEIR